MNSTETVGYITQGVSDLLSLGIPPQPIFWGASNKEHIKANHPATYQKYEAGLLFVIVNIIAAPDYVGYRNGAIEYIGVMVDGEILKVAVRPSKRGAYFARTMYPIQQRELDDFLAKGTLVKSR
jgi:hypothetical protein